MLRLYFYLPTTRAVHQYQNPCLATTIFDRLAFSIMHVPQQTGRAAREVMRIRRACPLQNMAQASLFTCYLYLAAGALGLIFYFAPLLDRDERASASVNAIMAIFSQFMTGLLLALQSTFFGDMLTQKKMKYSRMQYWIGLALLILQTILALAYLILYAMQYAASTAPLVRVFVPAPALAASLLGATIYGRAGRDLPVSDRDHLPHSPKKRCIKVITTAA